MTERVDCVVIGAGVVGLAIARALAMAGRETIILESQTAIGTGISSRNSEVIHAGMYYATNSLKARLCVEGNAQLQAFCQSHHVTYRMVEKLIVATSQAEEKKLEAILAQGRANRVPGLEMMSGAEAMRLEPELRCTRALHSPNTGILDAHGYMLALQGDAEAHGAALALNAPVLGGEAQAGGIRIRVGGDEPTELLAHTLVIAAGLGANGLGRAFGLKNVPPLYFCKGSYFTLGGKAPFERLIYPLPDNASLGLHYTRDLGGQGRFGPDVEWVEKEDYAVDPARAERFRAAIARYWPAIAERSLDAGYSGIRPKIVPPDETRADFVIQTPEETGAAGVIALYGIESPGLTSSLAIAEDVARIAARIAG